MSKDIAAIAAEARKWLDQAQDKCHNASCRGTRANWSRVCRSSALDALGEALTAADAELEAVKDAIRFLFTPGPGAAMPAYHLWPNGERNENEPMARTWNAKIDRLLDALNEDRYRAAVNLMSEEEWKGR